MRGFAFGLVLSVVALVGCSKTADNAAAGGTNAADAATSCRAGGGAGPAGPIALAQLPAPPAGQWSRSSSQDGAAATTDGKCLDGKPIDPTDGMP